MKSLFLDALSGCNQGRPPVWLMRQAGRYMPAYLALRQKYSLSQMFHLPDLAAKITCMPLDALGVDAAILFSDILVVAEMFGFQVEFPEKGGPFIQAELIPELSLHRRPAKEALSYVGQTIQQVKAQISVPLIGFCGGPFTVATYLLDRGAKGEFKRTLEWAYSHPHSLHKLLNELTEASIDYLRLQIEAGVQAVQIFDSWAGMLCYSQFHAFSLNYLKKIIDALRETEIPIIVFCRGSSLHASELADLRPAAISFDAQKELADLRKIVPKSIAVQGNLDPHLLKAPKKEIESSVKKLLESMSSDPGFIVNLGHGVLPDTPLENVQFFVDLVKRI
jgi:uroporphyrinogen decarboxylase